MHIRSWLLLLVPALTLTGCSQFHEQYIFRSGRPGKANYYRVTISGTTTFTSSQFAAGLYDAEAVDALFGELKGPGKLVSIGGTSFQPDTGTTQQTAPQPPVLTMVATSDAAGKTKPIESLEGKPVKEQKFVFFLSSNANAFINAIQTYVDSDRIQTAMVSLLLKDDVQKLAVARGDERAATARANALSSALNASVSALGTGDEAKSSDVRTATLKILSILANRSDTASPPSFDSVVAAETWLRNSPRAFRLSGGAR
jgi:hypothetical protein